jgi:TnpA family transposase
MSKEKDSPEKIGKKNKCKKSKIFSNQPKIRIKDSGSQQLYGFKSKKEYTELDYKLIPNHIINTVLIEKHWYDILRVMASLKLGKTTAEQVLKRLNS